jgi:hypothetical protein
LAYVAFTGDRKPRVFTCLVRGGTKSIIVKPDGTEVSLPSDAQLFENVDGEYKESPGRVSKDELEDFLKSRPDEYTIKALLDFAAARRR